MVEERSAEGAVEEVVGYRVALASSSSGSGLSLYWLSTETAVVAVVDELIHPAVIDLILLVIEAVNDVAGLIEVRHVLGCEIRLERQRPRETLVGISC